MENEVIEENTQDILEVSPAAEILQADVLENENVFPSVFSVGENGDEFKDSEMDKLIDGELDNGENIIETENGMDFDFESVSDNDGVFVPYDNLMSNYYVTNVYEVTKEDEIPLWETNIQDLGTTDFLLFLIFILLLVQFIHNLFKGSHWFKW